MTKWLAVGTAMVAAERMMRRRRALKSPPDLDADLAGRGISDVDPEGLMGMGEAVDADAVRHAHEDVVDQRAKLPEHGKNLP